MVPLPRRSLLIIAGKSRYTWLHAIDRKDIIGRRLSLTMRELSDEFLPPPVLSRPFLTVPSDDDKEKGSKEMTDSQSLGLELIKLASSFNGVCVAITSGELQRPQNL